MVLLDMTLLYGRKAAAYEYPQPQVMLQQVCRNASQNAGDMLGQHGQPIYTAHIADNHFPQGAHAAK
jgi:hypothetical protein